MLLDGIILSEDLVIAEIGISFIPLGIDKLEPLFIFESTDNSMIIGDYSLVDTIDKLRFLLHLQRIFPLVPSSGRPDL